MDHATRCAWIKQNDAAVTNHTPYLCGAAAAQMILYGRDTSKFKPTEPTKLKDTPAQLFTDQQKVWQAIVGESSTCPLPPGGTYDGAPEQTQICEAGATCWATFPAALARTITDGMTITAGHLGGVPARVVSLFDQDDVIPAIVDSIDRGVAAAVLANGWHWIVVYRYRELDRDRVEIYYRNGLEAKIGAQLWPNASRFRSVLARRTGGVYDNKYVLVTAESRVPIAPHAIGAPPIRLRPLPPATPGGTHSPVDFPPSLPGRLLAELASDKEWAPAFAGARFDRVFKVTNARADGTDYYMVDFVVDDYAGTTTVTRRTGSVIVDAYDLRRRTTTGIEERGEELPKLIDADEIKRQIDRLGIPGLVVDDDLTWEPCDQSASAFLPFYVVRDPSGPDKIVAYVRVDGRLFRSLTHSLAGI
jgi:hypothetical protein